LKKREGAIFRLKPCLTMGACSAACVHPQSVVVDLGRVTMVLSAVAM